MKITRKRVARWTPFGVLLGAVVVGVLALPQISVASPEAFNFAFAGVMFVFLARWFSRKFRSQMRAFHAAHKPKLSLAQKRDQRRADRKNSVWAGR